MHSVGPSYPVNHRAAFRALLPARARAGAIAGLHTYDISVNQEYRRSFAIGAEVIAVLFSLISEELMSTPDNLC